MIHSVPGVAYELHAVPKPKKVRGGKRGAPTGRPRTSPKRSRFQKNGPRTKKSGGALFPENVDETRRTFIRAQWCVLRNRCSLTDLWPGRHIGQFHYCTSPVRACHLKSRGAGGKDAGNMWPGCDAAHDEQHRLGIPKFQKRWVVNLAAECARREAEFLLESGWVERGGQTLKGDA